MLRDGIFVIAILYLGIMIGFLYCYVWIRVKENYFGGKKMVCYTCPKCGTDLEHIVLSVTPKNHIYRCPKCNFSDSKKEEMIKIPFVPSMYSESRKYDD